MKKEYKAILRGAVLGILLGSTIIVTDAVQRSGEYSKVTTPAPDSIGAVQVCVWKEAGDCLMYVDESEAELFRDIDEAGQVLAPVEIPADEEELTLLFNE